MISFKNSDGDTISIVAQYMSSYGRCGEYRITDLLIKPYRKRKEISLAARIRDDYQYRRLDREGRAEYVHQELLKYCTQEQLDAAVIDVYKSMRPKMDEIVYWIG